MSSQQHIDIEKNLLTSIESSLGSTLFRNLYMVVDDTSSDVLQDGELSCAYYVSSLLAKVRFNRSRSCNGIDDSRHTRE